MALMRRCRVFVAPELDDASSVLASHCPSRDTRQQESRPQR